MASDEHSWCFDGVFVTLRAIRTVMAEEGLHVVTAAEQAVLDAMAAVDEDTLRDRLSFKRLTLEDRAVYSAELARREAKESFTCGSCSDTGKWSNGIDCPTCGGLARREAKHGQ